MAKKDELKNRVLNGGRGSGQSLRLLVEVYENQIVDLQHKVDTLQGFLDHDIEYDMDKAIQGLKKENAELKEKLEKETAQRIYNFNKSIEWKEKHRGLKKENARLKQEYSDNLSLKDEELMCLETDFNTYKSEAKEIIKFLINPQLLDKPQYYEWRLKAEQFLKE